MLNAITSLLAPVGRAIEKVVPDKSEQARLKAEIQHELMSNEAKALETAASVITAEASGESWLQRNWRPLVMIWLAGLVGAHWLGFTAPNLSPEEVVKLLEIVQVGLGGYVVGRSCEKGIKAWKGGQK